MTYDQGTKHLVSSFASIAETVLNIVAAEKVWYERLMNIENPSWLPFTFKGDRLDTLRLWENSSQLLVDFVANMQNEHLASLQHYKRINGEAFTQPVYEILSHVLNHSTYHRGQLVTMLRQVGFIDVSSTDLLLYYRKPEIS
ncbi:MAG: DUF1572 family protein [Saprospiraceae bacterium]|nr:DUF1572 family protein [Saprospiraceae bacterium]